MKFDGPGGEQRNKNANEWEAINELTHFLCEKLKHE